MTARPAFDEAFRIYQEARRPGTGSISDAADLHVAPCGRKAVFTGTVAATLEGILPTRIFEINLDTGEVRPLPQSVGTARHARYSPDGRFLAWLSDEDLTGNVQLKLVERETERTVPTAEVPGWVEYFDWSPDARHLLLGVAGHGADIAGALGAVTSRRRSRPQAPWVPEVHCGDESFLWRQLSVLDLQGCSLKSIPLPGVNIWEAAWCGDSAIAAIASDAPEEGHWYSASLRLLSLNDGRCTTLYVPSDQLGLVSSSGCGAAIAFVEAVCSDRGVVAGDLMVVDREAGAVRPISTSGIDVSDLNWVDASQLLIAGHRGFETVIALVDLTDDRITEVWSSNSITVSGRYARVARRGSSGACVAITEGFLQAPRITLIDRDSSRTLLKLHSSYDSTMEALATVEQSRWRAPDGLQIEGWLLRPREGKAPYPLLMTLHGGPVWLSRPVWLGRNGAAFVMLLGSGCAIFLPNPRGSTGRGRSFARHVVGDPGGADALDCLSGLDQLVADGVADHDRLGVTGMSYGGYLTAWLCTQDQRFAAAAPVNPMTNFITQHLFSNIPHFVELFLTGSISNAYENYLARSPVMHAARVRTPMLSIGGALDRCTPPGEATQFHRVLCDAGALSTLVIYPQEGHGVRHYPAVIDYAARLFDWFAQHLSLGEQTKGPYCRTSVA